MAELIVGCAASSPLTDKTSNKLRWYREFALTYSSYARAFFRQLTYVANLIPFETLYEYGCRKSVLYFSALFSIPKKFYCIAAGGFDCACSRETHTGQECFVFVDTQVL